MLKVHAQNKEQIVIHHDSDPPLSLTLIEVIQLRNLLMMAIKEIVPDPDGLLADRAMLTKEQSG